MTARHLPFSVVAKPTGALCNLACDYCYFLDRDALAPGARLVGERLERYVATFLDAQPDGEVTMLWQGGEPLLAGLEWFEATFALARRLARPGQHVRHAVQTNATLVTPAWAGLFAREQVLVGVSVDGPAEIHDAHRVNHAGRGSHAEVVRGWRLLQDAGVELNVLTVVGAHNAHAPLEVYQHLRDDLGARFCQFIPLVEPDGAGGATPASVTGEAWGRFLTTVVAEWARHDVGTVFLQHVETMLAAAFGTFTMCVHAPTCGDALALHGDGGIYACDHFVDPAHRRGTAGDSFVDILTSPQQRAFGRDKLTSLPGPCLDCSVRWACHGGCPKDRIVPDPAGGPPLNWLCAGYRDFFSTTSPLVARMVALLRAGRAPAEVMGQAPPR